MYKIENSKLVAAISISILLACVLGNPIQSVLADSNKDEIQKQKQLAEEKAKGYLKQLGAKPSYAQINATSTDESGKDRNAEMQKAKLAVEEKAKQYLKRIGQETRKDITKPSYGELNSTSTVTSGKDRKAELEKAKQVSDEKAKETLEKLYPKLAQKKYGS